MTENVRVVEEISGDIEVKLKAFDEAYTCEQSERKPIAELETEYNAKLADVYEKMEALENDTKEQLARTEERRVILAEMVDDLQAQLDDAPSEASTPTSTPKPKPNPPTPLAKPPVVEDEQDEPEIEDCEEEAAEVKITKADIAAGFDRKLANEPWEFKLPKLNQIGKGEYDFTTIQLPKAYDYNMRY